jgi:hypothetical protein
MASVPRLRAFRCSSLTTAAVIFAAITCMWPQADQGKRQKDEGNKGNCGYPSYCARTDRKPEPYGQTPPPLGRAGSVITDPSFGSRILRVTDESSDPGKPGMPFRTPSSAEQNSWNRNSTLFYVLNSGGRIFLYKFDPANFHATQLKVPNVKWRGEPQFSYSNEDVLYGVSTKSPSFEKYEVSKDKLSTVNDATSCLKLDSSAIGVNITVSADDQRFMEVIGPKQDANNVVYIYDAQKGCRWYNTQTGEISGKWGQNGKASFSDSYLIHNARMSKSGKYVYVTGRGGASAIWDVDTTSVIPCRANPQDQCGGHRAIGYSHLINPSLRVHAMNLLKRPLGKIDQTSSLVPDLPPKQGWFGQHISWNNADPDDTTPACFSTFHPTNPDTPGAPLTVNGPWENEIDCIEMDGKGSKIWRFAHTYSTARNGFWSTPRGNVSPDGRFYMFTSDWQDRLGNDPKGKGFRTDVFVVELR